MKSITAVNGVRMKTVEHGIVVQFPEVITLPFIDPRSSCIYVGTTSFADRRMGDAALRKMAEEVHRRLNSNVEQLIVEELTGKEWTPDTLDRIVAILRKAGHKIEEPEEARYVAVEGEE